MSRRRQPPQSSHQPKGRKRPRKYHHGVAQGRVNESKIKRALPALDRAEEDMVEVAALAESNRREISDFRALIDGLVRVSPAVYAPFSGVEKSVSRQAHNLETAGSSPASATR